MTPTTRRPRGHRLIAALAVAALLVGPAPAARSALLTGYLLAGQTPAAPGTFYSWGAAATGSTGAQSVNVVTVDPADPLISFEASLSNDRATGLERTSAQARRASREGHRVVAAINGDVWGGYSGGGWSAPNGVHVRAGELMIAGTGLRPAFAVGADRRPRIGTIGVSIGVRRGDGSVLSVSRVNQSRRYGEIALYTPRFGASTLTSASGTEVLLRGAVLPLRPSGSVTATVAAVRRSAGNTTLGAGDLVLSAPAGGYDEVLATFSVGEMITLTTSITPGWEEVGELITGREWVVRDGAPWVWPRPSSADAAHPRSAAALTADGRVLLVTVDGRQPGVSGGVTLAELGQLLIGLGAVQAINLDGGGSTTLAVRRPGDLAVSLVNRPSDGAERSVSNALLVVSSAPTGPLASAILHPAETTVPQGGMVRFRAQGLDASYNPVAIDPAIVQWSLAGTGGEIAPDGTFRATVGGPVTIVATIAGIQASQALTVTPDTVPPVVAAPGIGFVTDSTVEPTLIPATVGWPAASDGGNGVAAYAFRRSTDGSPWVDVPLADTSSRSLPESLVPGQVLRYAVSATDTAGNASAWVESAPMLPLVAQEGAGAMTYTGTWNAARSSLYLGGGIRSSDTKGAKARLTVNASAVAWVAPRGPTRGSAGVYVDGKLAATVDLYRPKLETRRVVFWQSWPSAGRHTVEVRVLGTAGHARVDIDGFVVIDTPAADPVLVAAGDIASCGLAGDSATAALLDGIGGTIATLGDNAYESGSAAQFAKCYEPTWGRHRARTKPSPGNHDYGTAGAGPYFDYFGAAAGAPGQGWYAWDLGTWRVYALNSNCAKVGGCGPGSPQEQWLKADLAANPRSCVVAYWHHPLFSSGAHGNNGSTRALWEALYAAGAELVLSGHDHDYERFAPQRPNGSADPATGIREFVVGTGGASLRSFGTVRPNSEVRDASTAGVLRLALGATGYSWRFIPVTGGAFKDSGSGTCH